MSNNKELLKLILPSGLEDYFTITGLTEEEGQTIIHLSENNVVPTGYTRDQLESKGFYPAVTIQDFPLRGKAVYLKVKRRRWEVLSSGEAISRDWQVVAKGTRITQEFAAFLKGIHR